MPNLWNRSVFKYCALAALICVFSNAFADVTALDDRGVRITLHHPAQRIVSLAPHTTELLFAAGAGSSIVAVVQYSDYPEAAKKIPIVGNSGSLDVERIVSLRPDLVVAWESGNPAAQVARLQALGLTVFYSEPRRLEDIPSNIERLGVLAGTEAVAVRARDDFNRDYAALRASFAQKRPVPVFYQIWDRPLMTVNGAHLISAVLKLCGGENVFASLPMLVPTVGVEAVLKANPAVIFGRGGDADDDWRAAWRKWPRLEAVARDNLFSVAPDLLERQSPRMLQGAREVCAAIERARDQ